MNNKVSPLMNFTKEQREEFRLKAQQSRKERANIKLNIKEGKLTPNYVLSNTDNKIIGGIRISHFFHSLPKIGKKKAEDLIHKSDIDANKKLSKLTDSEKERIRELIIND